MANEQSFLAAIAESLEDDVPRLIFADWLEERGEDARAEFIRVQCELARLDPHSPRYPELHLRQLDLLAEHEHEWLGEWSERLVRWEFRRGFLHTATITPAPFLDHGEDLFARHPVERVAFLDDFGESLPAEEAQEVVASPVMRHVRSLDAAGCHRDEPEFNGFYGEIDTSAWLAALAKADHVVRLESLSLAGGTNTGRLPIDPGVWHEFCEASHLASLRELDLTDAWESEEPSDLAAVVADLGNAAFARRLRFLCLAGCLLTDETAVCLAASAFPDLQGLDLSGCDLLRATGLRAVLQSGGFLGLQSLGLPFGLDFKDLASSPRLAGLRSLRLRGDSGRNGSLGRRVGEGEWESLFRSAGFRELTELQIEFTLVGSISEAEAACFWQAPWIARLRKLSLGYRFVPAGSFQGFLEGPHRDASALHTLRVWNSGEIGQALSEWPGLARLVDLSFFAGRSPAETERLLSSPFLGPRLGRLDLIKGGTELDCIQRLASCPAFQGLRWLAIGFAGLTPEAVSLLAQSPYLRHLEALHLGANTYGMERVEASEAVRPLAHPDAFPRLRDLVVSCETSEDVVAELRARFGPRLRVYTD
jgi:uncharacterized protein (TIGR02996 family)